MGLSKKFRVNKTYSMELKKRAEFKVLTGAMRKSDALREYGICGSISLDRWMERYGHGILTEHKELPRDGDAREERGC